MAIAVAVALVVAGCSDSSDGPAGGTAGTVGSSSTTAPEDSTTILQLTPTSGPRCGPGCTPAEDAGSAGPQRLELEVATAEIGIPDDLVYGRGVSVVDMDGDGWDDLFLSDTDARLREGGFGTSRVFRNVKGRFEPWDLGIDEDDIYQNGGAIFGDYTGDGAPDVFLLNGNNTGPSTLALYENRLADEGRFVRRTDSAGITDESNYWWGATWIDVDGDDRLDLVVTGLELLLYRNLGDGTFAEEASARGVGFEGDLHNPVAADFDGDFDQDLFVASLSGSRFFENDGTGHFKDTTTEALGEDFTGRRAFGWIAAAADFDQDGNEDLWLGRWYFRTMLFLGRGDGTFERHGLDVGIDSRVLSEDPTVVDPLDAYAGLLAEGLDASENTMGLVVGDIDGNGYPDAIVGPGSPSLANPLIAFCAKPDPETRVRFERCSEPIRTAVGESRVHGSAIADLDRDGDADVVVNPGGFPPYDVSTGADTREQAQILVGTAGGAGRAHLRLVSAADGRTAVGARVEARSDRGTFWYTIRTSVGFENDLGNDLLLVVGSGADVTITWPDGSRTDRRINQGEDLVEARP